MVLHENSAQFSAFINVIAFNVQLFSSLFIIIIKNRKLFSFLAGRFVIKSIDNSLWNLSGTDKGFKNPFRFFFHKYDLPQMSQFL
jgi:hypothetical protein